MTVELEARAPAVPGPAATKRTLSVGLLGCGTVGAKLAAALLDRAAWQPELRLHRVAVLHPNKDREVKFDPSLVTDDAFAVVKDPDVDVVIELIGGSELPTSLIRQALVEGKHVITANKEVMATHGAQLTALAADRGVSLLFEGAVGGAVPLVHVVEEALAGDRVTGFVGILNGTTNYILDEMSRTGCSLEGALEEARRRGYAEADSSADISGRDAASKTAILASLAFGCPSSTADVFYRGIESVARADVEAAAALGYEIRLVASAELVGDSVHLRAEPCAVPSRDVLAGVRGADNVVVIESELAGRITLAGPGAGGRETASAVLADLERIRRGRVAPPASRTVAVPRLAPPRDMPGRFFVSYPSRTRAEVTDIGRALLPLGIRAQASISLRNGTIAAITGMADRSCVERALGPIAAGPLTILPVRGGASSG